MVQNPSLEPVKALLSYTMGNDSISKNHSRFESFVIRGVNIGFTLATLGSITAGLTGVPECYEYAFVSEALRNLVNYFARQDSEEEIKTKNFTPEEVGKMLDTHGILISNLKKLETATLTGADDIKRGLASKLVNEGFPEYYATVPDEIRVCLDFNINDANGFCYEALRK